MYSYYLCLTVGNCVNVDECNGIADCGDNSQCQDLTPGFECRCNEGYKKSEDGSTCVGMLIALLCQPSVFNSVTLNNVCQLNTGKNAIIHTCERIGYESCVVIP